MKHENQEIKDVLISNYMPYTAHVILERALPEIDGLKPSQRRILYTMYKMKLLSGGRKKSQGVVGSTMFLHPHGDGAIYEALVRMSKDSESLLIPYIDSKGNFGKEYSRDMKYASARYTEVKLAEVAKEFFEGIDKEAVVMKNNYDGTMTEPSLLPVSLPFILMNPQSGIANGMASKIASINSIELIDYVIAYLNDPKGVKAIDYIKEPDFPTGARIIKNDVALNQMLEKGVGTFTMRSNYIITENSIIFPDMPFGTSFESVIEKISDLAKLGKLKEVVDVDDIYGKSSTGIEVTLKKNTDKEMFAEKLFKLTALESKFSCNFNLVVNGRPKVLGVKDIIKEWVIFRAQTIQNMISHDIKLKEKRLSLLQAFSKVILDIDEAIRISRETKKSEDIRNALMERFDIDEAQAEYIADIKLRNLTKDYLLNRISEVEKLTKEIEKLNKVLNSKRLVANMIVKQLTELKKVHGKERMTEIIELSDVKQSYSAKSEAEDYNLKLFISEEGYVKKIPLTSLRGNFSIKVKDGDSITQELELSNTSEMLVFTDKQNVYKLKLYDLEDHKPSVLGDYLPSLLSLKDEKILHVTGTKDFEGSVIVGFEDGKVAKIDLKAYQTVQNRSMLKNAYANKKALFIKHVQEDVHLMAVSSINKAIILNTSFINSKASKTTQGVQFMKGKKDSYVTTYKEVKELDEDVKYYLNSNAGVGKYLKK